MNLGHIFRYAICKHFDEAANVHTWFQFEHMWVRKGLNFNFIHRTWIYIFANRSSHLCVRHIVVKNFILFINTILPYVHHMPIARISAYFFLFCGKWRKEGNAKQMLVHAIAFGFSSLFCYSMPTAIKIIVFFLAGPHMTKKTMMIIKECLHNSRLLWWEFMSCM
jgi:hypothetical protein